jgi:hypothetical protein
MSVTVHSEIELRSIFIAVLKKNIPRVPIFIGLSAFATNPTSKPEFNLNFLNFLNFVLFNQSIFKMEQKFYSNKIRFYWFI